MSKTNPEVFTEARHVLGQYLRDIRKSRGMTQIDLAAAAGIRQADVSNVENGTHNYGVDHLLSYVRAVDCYFFLADREGEHLNTDHMVGKSKDPI